MKKFFTKPLITVLMIVYCIVNFATFASASVCIAKDHIGLNMFGIDACCIARHQVIITDEGQISITSEDCSDKSISSNSNEIVPDNSVPLYVGDYVAVNVLPTLDSIYNINSKQINFSDKQARAPDIGYLEKIKTVRLTI